MTIFADLKEVAMLFKDDVLWHNPPGHNVLHMEQHQRRGYVRVVLAFFEAIIYSAKPDTPGSRPSGRQLTHDEMSVIEEHVVELGDKGDVRRRPLFLPLRKNLRFTFPYSRICTA